MSSQPRFAMFGRVVRAEDGHPVRGQPVSQNDPSGLFLKARVTDRFHPLGNRCTRQGAAEGSVRRQPAGPFAEGLVKEHYGDALGLSRQLSRQFLCCSTSPVFAGCGTVRLEGSSPAKVATWRAFEVPWGHFVLYKT